MKGHQSFWGTLGCYISYSLNFFEGAYIGDYIGDHSRFSFIKGISGVQARAYVSLVDGALSQP